MIESKFHIYCIEIYDEQGNYRRICKGTEPLNFEIESWARDFAERYDSSKVKVVIRKIPVEVVEE